ncbi:MAG: extracellular solute-binding protein [Spirochaetaceae bacterium]|nr:extracellular solute-binding protein [Spirochaetaceae bacterium]
MKRLFSAAALLALGVSFVFAGGGQQQPSSGSGVTKISILATNAGNDANTEQTRYRIEKFNEAYKGKYEAVVEWIPGMAEDIRAKLKMLNTARDLPPVVSDLGTEPSFAELLFRNNRLIDLKPYFDADSEWQRLAFPESVAYNTRDGKMYSAPAVTTDYTGIYYNKEHFTQAGISRFPETWDEFWAACDKLKAAGHTPISLHLTETGWCTMLMASTYLGRTAEGQAFMNQQFPTDYNTPQIIDMLNMIKRLYTYTTRDAQGGNYALAANNFSNETTSMIPNGPWMMQSLSDPAFSAPGFDQKVAYAKFPGGIMISSQGTGFGSGVSVDVSRAEQEAAVEWIRFLSTNQDIIRYEGRMNGAFSPLVPLTGADTATFSPPMKSYADIVPTVQKTIPNYQSRWDVLTQHEVIETEMINLVNGVISAEEMAAKMTAAARRYAAENQ